MDFNTLLQQGQRLTNETQTSEELPRAERTILHVLEATKECIRVKDKLELEIYKRYRHILLDPKGIDLS